MTFGEKIQRLRKSNGFSQEELAEQLSVTRQTISKWELDQSTPELEYIAQLSDIFGVTTDYLIKADGDVQQAGNTKHTQNPVVIPRFENQTRYTFGFLLGLVLTCIGAIGMLVFVILSTTNPWTAVVDRYVFSGLFGYLFGTNSLGYFVILAVLTMIGLSLAIWGIAKKSEPHNKD